ncbi:MAG: cell wall hydrolase [Butyribacter sp.]|nr:cell wall hydrolase [bacterium]MDY3855232.1 cell wall hydrolase [Butyribacter sp.]
MYCKKFALLMLTMFLLLGLSGKPVSVSAKEDVTVENTVVNNENNTVTDNCTESSEESNTEDTTAEDENNVATVPVQTPASSIVNKSTTTTISTVSPKKQATVKKVAKKKKTKKSKKATYKKSELRLMASIINCEAGGEGMQGKLAVGVVIMNRVKSKSFPNTIKKVVYQKGQFSPVRNGSLRKRLRQYDAGKTHSKQWKDCITAAKKVLKGQRTVVVKGKVKNMKGYHFFSVRLPHARMKLGGHRFK